MRVRDRERVLDVSFLRLCRVLDESMICSDSSDNESSEENSVGTSGFSDESFNLF